MTVTMTTTPLSRALREETSRAHAGAEGSDFMTRLLAGELSPEALATFTGQLWFIYEALERAVRNGAQTPIVGAVADPRLERREALELDLAEMLGVHWRDEVRILPATARYVARLESLDGADSAPEVVAHHYVRYLGDVSGGQVIAARLGALYGIDPDALNFYNFAAIGKIPPYRMAYRSALDELELSEAQRASLLAEAKAAFAFNSGVFAELTALYPSA